MQIGSKRIIEKVFYLWVKFKKLSICFPLLKKKYVLQ